MMLVILPSPSVFLINLDVFDVAPSISVHLDHFRVSPHVGSLFDLSRLARPVSVNNLITTVQGIEVFRPL